MESPIQLQMLSTDTYFAVYILLWTTVCVCCCLQRATSDEMEKIKKHYETSKEDEVKLLDKPEQ